MVFYLKINRPEAWALQYMQHWIRSIETLPGENTIYFVCEKNEIKNNILEMIYGSKLSCQFVESVQTSQELDRIVSYVASKRWKNAAYSHLTTFFHAQEHGYESFWNIDADDTCFCLDPERTGDLLRAVENHVTENNIDIISLDMYRSRTAGKQWSFGVTFTRNTVNWMDILRNHCADKEYAEQADGIQNIDDFFQYMKKQDIVRVETFCCDNLRFIHCAEEFMSQRPNNGFYHWKDGVLSCPSLLYCVGLREDKTHAIYEDVHQLDIGLTDDDSYRFFLASARAAMGRSNTQLLESIPEKSRVILYGAKRNGRVLVKKILESSRDFSLLCIADRNWETLESVHDVPVCSIETAVSSHEFDFVVISSKVHSTCLEMRNALLSANIPDEKIKCIYNLE